MAFYTKFPVWSIINMNSGEDCQMSSDLLITTFIPLPRSDGNQTVMVSYGFSSADALSTLSRA